MFAGITSIVGHLSVSPRFLGFTFLIGFWDTAPSRPRGAVTICFEAPRWRSMRFDATLGFPGEGPASPPSFRQWHYKPLFFPAPALQSPCKSWVQWARATMVGTLPIHSSDPILASSSDHHIHLCLLALAERGNQGTPIAARLQSRPARIGALLGAGDPTTLAAAGGSAYNFHTRPFQYSRPKPLKLDRFPNPSGGG